MYMISLFFFDGSRMTEGELGSVEVEAEHDSDVEVDEKEDEDMKEYEEGAEKDETFRSIDKNEFEAAIGDV